MRAHFLLAILLFLPNFLFAQSGEIVTDSAFAAYMDSADAHLEQTQYYSRLQTKYAREFYHYFLKNPDSEIGKEAMLDAFIMWINTGNREKCYEAMGQIDYDSDLWYDILRQVGSSNLLESDRDKYHSLLTKLELNITDPKNKTAVLYLISKYFMREGSREKVKSIFRDIIELNADDYYTKIAREHL